MTLPSVRQPLGRLRGLDGIRAVAVAAVVVYHLGLGFGAGGFLGVEVFFVVSGYLITALLLADWEAHGLLRLRSFWFRRARRLLPALAVTLVAVLTVAVVAFPSEVVRLREDSLAAATYVTNWYLVFGQQSYFDTAARQSPLLHLWSLAIEEQFYLVWPILLGVALWLGGRRGGAVLAGVGIVASVVVANLLFAPDADPSRLYYGTDTRAAGLLVGALLAFAYVPIRPIMDIAPPRATRLAADGLAIAALVALVAAFLLVDETQPIVFRGGLVVLDAVTAVLIVTVVAPASRVVPAVLESAPLRSLGTRSYAVYLWHWPVFTFTRPGLDVALDGPANVALRLLLTCVLSELSYRFVEAPVRAGALGRLWREWRTTSRSWPARLADVRAMGAVASTAAVALLVTNVATATPAASSFALPVADVDGLVTPPPDDPGDAASNPTPTASDPEGAVAVSSPKGRRPVAGTTGSTVADPTHRPAPSPSSSPGRGSGTRVDVPGPVLGLGESVLIAAAPSLARVVGPFDLDAVVGRQVDGDLGALRRRAAAGKVGQVLIMNIGNNGPIYPDEADQAVTLIENVPIVVWINVAVPRPWQDRNNRIIGQIAASHPNVRLVDWRAASAGHPEYFAPDGYHPNRAGSAVLASLVAAALR